MKLRGASRRPAGAKRFAARPGWSTTRRKHDRLLVDGRQPGQRARVLPRLAAEMPGATSTRRPGASPAPGRSPTSTSATYRGRCRATSRTSSTTATSTWPRSSSILREEGYDGVLRSGPRAGASTAPRPGTLATPIRSATCGRSCDARGPGEARARPGGTAPPRSGEDRGRDSGVSESPDFASLHPDYESAKDEQGGREMTSKGTKGSARGGERCRAGAVRGGCIRRRDSLVDAELGRAARPRARAEIRGGQSRHQGQPRDHRLRRAARAHPDGARLRLAARSDRGAARLGRALCAGRPGAAARRRAGGQGRLRPGRARLRHLGRKALGHPLPHRDARRDLQQGDVQGRRPRSGEAAADLDRAGRHGEEADRRRASTASPSPAAASSATPSSARCPSSG